MLELIAVDLGAESGRVMLGSFDGSCLRVEEVHRFVNRSILVGETLYWDVLALFAEMLDGMRRAGQKRNAVIQSIGVDSWGVDFALLDKSRTLLTNPVHYRDRRTEGMIAYVLEHISADDLYAATGIQIMPINTIFQLAAVACHQEHILSIAEHFAMIPDLLHFWLSGVLTCEYTNATTTQCLEVSRRTWLLDLLDCLGIPSRLFRPVIEPGTIIGYLRTEVSEATGLTGVRVIVPATHDTASAVLATPLEGPDAVYISSGTWSLVGVESIHPLITPESRQINLTNEGGVENTYRILKNVMGLWLLQECRRTWARHGQLWEYHELVNAAAAETTTGLIDPDDPMFLSPGDMVSRIVGFLAATGQPVSETPGAITRVILQSLALKYRWVIERLEHALGKTISSIHIVGGGVHNTVLNQMVADATGRQVIVGPAEAAAIGNLLIQLQALGEVNDRWQARELVRRSFALEEYQPTNRALWDEAYDRFLNLLATRQSRTSDDTAEGKSDL